MHGSVKEGQYGKSEGNLGKVTEQYGRMNESMKKLVARQDELEWSAKTLAHGLANCTGVGKQVLNLGQSRLAVSRGTQRSGLGGRGDKRVIHVLQSSKHQYPRTEGTERQVIARWATGNGPMYDREISILSLPLVPRMRGCPQPTNPTSDIPLLTYHQSTVKGTNRMTSPNPTKLIRPGRLWTTRSRSSIFSSSAPLAEASVAKDLEEEPDNDPENPMEDDDLSDDESDSDLETLRQTTSGPSLGHSMLGSYRRPSFAMAGSRATTAIGQQEPMRAPSRNDRREARRQERSLLRDNHIIPPKHPRKGDNSERIGRRASRLLSVPGILGDDRKASHSREANETVAGDSTSHRETSPLLGDPQLPYGGQDNHANLDIKWEEAVLEGKIQTTWQREAKVLARYSGPLVLTFILQYSLTVASIFVVGHIGVVELGAVSLASMTANITGYAVYQGLATSLDTLCAQAYGSGRKKLVGLQTQRMVCFLWMITIPIGIIWLCAEQILEKIVPEKDVAVLAGRYLRIVLIGAPGYATFESGKRYLQAQGLFSASLYVLLICAPLNAFMNWLFVWQFKWGFTGAPIAVAVTDNLLPILLVLYVRFVAGRQCWPGLTKRALGNWLPMVRLALPGLLMVEAEVLAFEILTLAASYFGTSHLAAQSILSTLTCITFQIPFPISIAASTRIANLIGATLADAAKTSARVAGFAAVFVGVLNVVLLSSLRNYIPQLFTNDPDVIDLVAKILPLCAAFQLFDALAACCNGILRGLGRQEVGGYVQLFCYYVVAIPVSMGTGFGLGWQLYGLWAGVAIALGLVAVIEGIFLSRISWERSVEDARSRNERS